MPVDYAKVQEIFLNVLKEPAGLNRVALIDEACGKDIELRDFVRGMLDIHEKNATPIPQGPTRFEDRTQGYTEPALSAGTILGDRYKIIELIAEGGMGSVYRACRISDMKMEVAIKVIKPGMDSQQVLSRFNIEKQALAIMKHDNIARVLDAGMTDKRLPYFVMELVKGLNLTKFCDDSKLTIEQRLELFEQICSAVQHAHQKGIVHRDLKPSNILVALYDDKPVPKVIDFGLAKALYQPLTDDDIRTRFGMFVGTWQYTAPEQARLNNLDIDTRADIYSLGVILYELLTGTTPLEKRRLINAAYEEVLRMIREEEPPKPSTKIHSSDECPSIAALRHSDPAKLERQLRGELDWIVMKALDKDRNRRYATANEFAADIRRYLVDEPVQAGPPTFRYKAGKYLRKHKGKVLTVALLVAIAIIGAVVSTIGWMTASRENKKATVALNVKQGVMSFLLEDLLNQASPYTQVKPPEGFSNSITVKSAVNRAAENVGKRFVDKPEVEAAIRHTLGKTYIGLGDLEKAKKQLSLAESIYREKVETKSLGYVQTVLQIAILALNESHFEEALRQITLARQLAESLITHNDPTYVQIQYTHGCILLGLGKQTDAEKTFNELIQNKKLEDVESRRYQAMAQVHLAGIWLDQNKLEQAEKLLNETIALQNELLGKGSPDALATENILALLLLDRNQTKKAIAILERIVEESARISGPGFMHHLSFSINLATAYFNDKQFEKAEVNYQKLIPKLKEVYGVIASETLAASYNLACTLIELKKYKEAEKLLLDAYGGARVTFGESNENTMMILKKLAQFYEKINDQEKAAQYRKKLEEAKPK